MSANALRSSRYRSSPAAIRSFTTASISDGVNPSGNAEVETIRLVRASGGKSHSNVTPTT